MIIMNELIVQQSFKSAFFFQFLFDTSGAFILFVVHVPGTFFHERVRIVSIHTHTHTTLVQLITFKMAAIRGPGTGR